MESADLSIFPRLLGDKGRKVALRSRRQCVTMRFTHSPRSNEIKVHTCIAHDSLYLSDYKPHCRPWPYLLSYRKLTTCFQESWAIAYDSSFLSYSEHRSHFSNQDEHSRWLVFLTILSSDSNLVKPYLLTRLDPMTMYNWGIKITSA